LGTALSGSRLDGRGRSACPAREAIGVVAKARIPGPPVGLGQNSRDLQAAGYHGGLQEWWKILLVAEPDGTIAIGQRAGERLEDPTEGLMVLLAESLPIEQVDPPDLHQAGEAVDGGGFEMVVER
jgi:hypothetical protein